MRSPSLGVSGRSPGRAPMLIPGLSGSQPWARSSRSPRRFWLKSAAGCGRLVSTHDERRILRRAAPQARDQPRPKPSPMDNQTAKAHIQPMHNPPGVTDDRAVEKQESCQFPGGIIPRSRHPHFRGRRAGGFPIRPRARFSSPSGNPLLTRTILYRSRPGHPHGPENCSSRCAENTQTGRGDRCLEQRRVQAGGVGNIAMRGSAMGEPPMPLGPRTPCDGGSSR